MRNLILILLVLLFSCETIVDPRLPDNGPGLVVYSFFRPGSRIQIDAFNTIPVRQAETVQRNKDLSIRLLENGEFVEQVTANAQGVYLSSIIPSAAGTYSFEATAGSIKLSATSHIPEAVEISGAQISDEIQYTSAGEYGYPAQLSFTDHKEAVNFYSLEVLVENCSGECNEETLHGKLNELLVEDLKVNTSGNMDVNIGSGPEAIDGVKYIYFSDDGLNGESITFKFFIVPLSIDFNKSQNIKFVLKSISREYYEYLRTSDFQQELEEGSNLSEPVQISTNIHNGLGTFAGYNYSVYTLRH